MFDPHHLNWDGPNLELFPCTQISSSILIWGLSRDSCCSWSRGQVCKPVDDKWSRVGHHSRGGVVEYKLVESTVKVDSYSWVMVSARWSQSRLLCCAGKQSGANPNWIRVQPPLCRSFQKSLNHWPYTWNGNHSRLLASTPIYCKMARPLSFGECKNGKRRT